MMAVHAQYASNAVLPDFQTITTSRATNNNNGFKDQGLNRSAVISDPNSDLTCNVPGSSRKRNRDAAAEDTVINQQFQLPVPSKIQSLPNYQQHRLLGSAGTSSSGRPFLRPQSQHITEIDQLIRLHSAKMRSGIDEIQKKQCRELTQILEAQASKKFYEKDAEIEALKRTQAELEARLKQVTAENRIWFTVARNSESLVAVLKASLDQALRRNIIGGGGECHVAGAQVAEDAGSCCYEGDSGGRRRPVRGVCRVCNERSVSVLVLPCRHLCLCLQCEPVSDTCPICYAAKNVGLQVFLE